MLSLCDISDKSHILMVNKATERELLQTNGIQKKSNIISIPVADSCDVELDFLPIPLPPFGERS